jgi:hypothetical protein
MRFKTTLADFESSTISAVLLNDHPGYSVTVILKVNRGPARIRPDYVTTERSGKPLLCLFSYIFSLCLQRFWLRANFSYRHRKMIAIGNCQSGKLAATDMPVDPVRSCCNGHLPITIRTDRFCGVVTAGM